MHLRLHLTLLRAALISVAAFGMAACSSGARPSLLALEDEKTEMRVALAEKIGVSPIEVEQALDTTPQQQTKVALAVAHRVKQRYGTSDDKAMQLHLQGVVKKLALGVHAKPQDFELIILNSGRANAFTPGGGIVLINEGLLRLAQTEAQVAAVIAHEMGHVLMKHPQRQKQIRLASKMGSAMMDGMIPSRLQSNVGRYLRLGGNVTMNGMIRQQEMMADAIAIDMLVKAGYEPRAMVEVLQALRGHGTQMDRVTNVIYGNHPLTIDRELAAAKKINTRYEHVEGTNSTLRFDALVRPYHKKRNRRVASHN